MSYTQSVILRVNTPQVRKRFEELGYKIGLISDAEKILYASGGLLTTVYHLAYGFKIDCGTNIELALALAALRDDFDNYQWFTNGNDWMKCPSCYDAFEKYIYNEYDDDCGDIVIDSYHKATPEELIKDFRKEEL